jgi:hypothetical protein
MKLQILTAASVRMTDFYDSTLCSVVENDRRLTGSHCTHQQSFDEEVSTSESSANFYDTQRRRIPEDCYLH